MPLKETNKSIYWEMNIREMSKIQESFLEFTPVKVSEGRERFHQIARMDTEQDKIQSKW